MNDAIKVHVVDYGKHRNLVARYRDPVTGKHKSRSTGTRKRKKADKFAAKWEAELQEGRYKAPSKVLWSEFRARYEDEVLAGLADRTEGEVCGIFNAVERHLGIEKLAALNSERISRLQQKLRDAGRSETTIKKHMAHLKAALNWAKRQGMIHELPAIEMPRRAKSSKVMKGRPITAEEFERMLAKVPDVLFVHEKRMTADQRQAVVDSWRRYLRGLWLSGLRLQESMDLWWDDRNDKLSVDTDGRYIMLRIPAELEKGHQDRLYPVAPEFAEFLQAVPESGRTGPVFNPLSVQHERYGRLASGQVGRIVSSIGDAANVKVHTDRNGRVKFASAHDLRRSFGERWASRVMPQTLMELMRHESIETTLKFYVGRNAENTAEALYRAVGNTLGNTAPEPAPAEPPAD